MNTPLTITEDDIAAYLLNSPDFFVRNADLLDSIQLTSPHGNRAVSLQERQLELLRDKIRALELHLANMMRLGNENDQLQQKLLDWIITLLQSREINQIPDLIVNGLQKRFNVPHIALRIWRSTDSAFATSPYTQAISQSIQSFANSMNGEPYCGRNPDLEAVHWLGSAETIRSVALMPLYDNFPQQTFGLLVLGSPDENRFSPDLGVDLLETIMIITSAALKRCLK